MRAEFPGMSQQEVTPLHLPELFEGDGVVLVQVSFLYGSFGDALQLLLRHVTAQHRPQHLSVTAV